MGKQTMINNMKDNIINIFSSYLDTKGYNFNESQIMELVEIYLDCQEWDDNKILTGLSTLEMYDWIKHTKEVEVLNESNAN